VQLDLRLSCAKLSNRDGFGNKSDPFCVVSEKDQGGNWCELGRTEVVDNNHGTPPQPLRPSNGIFVS
jgi:hypothetical protein